MADPRTETETDADLRPDEAARLLAAARRAREDVAAGRIYRVDEAFLRHLLDAAGEVGRPLTRAEVTAFLEAALARGEIERAPDVAPTPADA